VDVKDSGTKLPYRAREVDHLPDEVGRVQVQPEVRIRNPAEHLSPMRWAVRDVVTPRPLVVAEDHRTVLYRDPHIMIGGKLNERWPDLAESLQIYYGRLSLVVADESADGVDAKCPRCLYDPSEMVMHHPAFSQVWIERVRIISERGNGQLVALQIVSDLIRCLFIKTRNVYMGDAGITTACASPTGQQATSSASKPFDPAQATTWLSVKSGKTELSSPSFTSSPPPRDRYGVTPPAPRYPPQRFAEPLLRSGPARVLPQTLDRDRSRPRLPLRPLHIPSGTAL
jgi:hypothetical protein